MPRKFVKTVNVITSDLQPGQWVRLPGAKRSSRFVGFVNGVPVTVKPGSKTKVVNTAAFRLARRKALIPVLGAA